MPEGDAVHRAAARLKVLEGEIVSVETPHPRAAVLGLAERLDGRRLERVEAVGKHILLGFEGGLLLRSHLRMRGRWSVRAAGSRPRGTPWLVLRGRRWQATLWNGPVLQLTRRHSSIVARLGPDIMAEPPDLDAMLGGLRSADGTRELGEILLDQGLVSGIGNKWKAEALFAASLSPWTRLRDVPEDGLRRVLEAAARLMRAGGGQRQVYLRAGRPCRRCGALIRSFPQGESARTAYWCPGCQGGTGPPGA